MDYEMQVCAEESSKEKSNNNVTNDLGASKKTDKVSRKSNGVSFGGSIRKSNSTLKVSPRNDARARAERIQSFKANMQRVKHEKEETEMKRL
ncbi:hypothetical protein M569_11780 [Genlisea aurea]|uniref:Uncharacterized protein n=1 Tax=Genlisea aurea TaxID=192259 RepID=S8DT65_9LAMI|nr:hypothetical protein M569_11780 [Genlisea aurea]